MNGENAAENASKRLRQEAHIAAALKRKHNAATAKLAAAIRKKYKTNKSRMPNVKGANSESNGSNGSNINLNLGKLTVGSPHGGRRRTRKSRQSRRSRQ